MNCGYETHDAEIDCVSPDGLLRFSAKHLKSFVQQPCKRKGMLLLLRKYDKILLVECRIEYVVCCCDQCWVQTLLSLA